jgi:cobalt-precorrin 5A hydrolase
MGTGPSILAVLKSEGTVEPSRKKDDSMTRSDRIAIWALTREGARLGRRMGRLLTGSHLFLGGQAGDTVEKEFSFERLGDALPAHFHRYDGHVFIMATGIVVRSVAHLLQHKTKDPAVVVVDECGQHAISLLSGHLGGANALARRIGDGIGARPVITTATDLQKVPAIDLIAQERGLFIETPESIRHVSMALLEGRSISLHDPYGYLAGALPDENLRANGIATGSVDREKKISPGPGVWVDDIRVDLPSEILILRPATLFVGVGCNRGTPAAEIRTLLDRVLDHHQLAVNSIAGLASIDLKADEKGLLELAAALNRPLTFFTRDQLATIKDIPSPSTMVEKHVGVKSVCEAAAILASKKGRIIAPKQTTPNATIAIARQSSTSSA